jgi:dTDP-L-rhamnose 4-epimerase
MQIDQQHVLVTGGAGFIGCALSQRLAPRARSFVVMDNLHPQVHASRSRPASLHPAAQLIEGDVAREEDWDRVLAQIEPTLLFHFAAETGTGQSLTVASRHGLVNVVGTTRLTDALGRRNIAPAHVVVASSRAVYGEGAWRAADGTLKYPGQRTRQQLERNQWDFAGMAFEPAAASRTHPAPSSVYGATKLAQEHILRAWTAAQKTRLSILRLQNVYGPGQSLTNSYTGIVALFCRLAKAGDSIPLYEDGKVTRDFVYIDDVADALVAAALTPPVDVRTCDVGSGVVSTIAELAGQIARAYGAPSPHVCGKFRDGDVRHAACDLSAAQTELGWTPRWPLARGLTALRGWIDAQEIRG